MVKVNKAYFPYNLILFIFKKTMRKPNAKVAMIDPIFLKILTLGDPYITEKHYNHEYRHIQQVKKLGRFKFIIKYLYYSIRYGYTNNPFEVDARENVKTSTTRQ